MFAGGYEQVVVIGTDTPWMNPQTVRKAFGALRKFAPEVFRGIPWSTHRVCSSTLHAATRANLSAKLLRKDFDLDRPGDLLRACRLFKKYPKRALHLANVLAALVSPIKD